MAENSKSRDNLGYLGPEFQYKLVRAFMDDHKFFVGINNIIDQNMFTESALRTYVGVLKEYYEVHEMIPSYQLMEIELRSKSKNDLEIQTYVDTLKKIKQTPNEGIDSIRDIADRFFKQQNLTKAINKISKVIENGEYDRYYECEDIIRKALEVGSEEYLGIGVFDNLELVLSDDYRCPIPTGIGKIDETLEGGLGKGELGIVLGPSSFGKTSLTTAMASHAATYKCDKNDYKGFKVLQIVFEDREKQIQRKHLGRIADVEAKDLSKPNFKEQVLKSINNFEDYELIKNNIRIIRFQSGEKTASQIRQFIKKLINSGFKPDMVIVDYFECVKLEAGTTAGDNEWSREGITMRKFESMANELDIALWVPIQGTKDSLGAELVTMSQGGGSVKKIQIGHIIMSIARTMESIERNLATIAILKNRAGKAGKVFNNVEFNNGTCRISTDNIDEFNMVEYNEDKQKQREQLAKEVINGLGKK